MRVTSVHQQSKLWQKETGAASQSVIEVVPVLTSRSSEGSAWKRTEGRTREGRGESSGTVAFIDSVAVQAISSRMKAERVLKDFILRDL